MSNQYTEIIIRQYESYTQYGYMDDDKFIIHRDNDLPAIEWANGSKAWYVNGQRHRDNNLPAIEWASGDKAWYVNGQRHRDNDLPAIEWTSGYKEWYVNGQKVPEPTKPTLTDATDEELLRELARRLSLASLGITEPQ